MNNVQIFDGKIPKGSFHADLDDEQIRAMIFQERIGEELAKNYPEIVDLYRDIENYQTLAQIAAQYVSPEHSKEVKRHAVAYAVKQLIDADELRELQDQRKRRALEVQVGGFDNPEFRERCRNALKRRMELGIVPDMTNAIRNRGLTPWTNDEREYAKTLANLPEYQHQRKDIEGIPDYGLIALDLNITFHDCNEIRTAKTTSEQLRYLNRKQEKRE